MDDFLMHHGILGQRWGQRNGPPYPLGSDQKSTREKRAKSSGAQIKVKTKSSKKKKLTGKAKVSKT